MTTTAFAHWTALHAWWCARQHEREAVGHQWAPRKTQIDVAEDGPTAQAASPATPTVPGEGEAVGSSAPSPGRLALVDARNQLATDPDQGADVDEVTFAAVKAHYGRLDPAAKAWLGALIDQAKRRGVTFHARDVRSVRTFELYRGLIALAAAGSDDDDILRALLVRLVGDVALFAGVEPGHVLGSLDWRQAARFAAIVDAFNSTPDDEAPA